MEEKYGVVTLKVFYDINHKKLLVNGGFAPFCFLQMLNAK